MPEACSGAQDQELNALVFAVPAGECRAGGVGAAENRPFLHGPRARSALASATAMAVM